MTIVEGPFFTVRFAATKGFETLTLTNVAGPTMLEAIAIAKWFLAERDKWVVVHVFQQPAPHGQLDLGALVRECSRHQ